MVGTQFQVNTYTTSAQQRSSVGIDANGDFVVVWQSSGSAGTDTSDRSIQSQRYDASGNAIGTQFQVNTYTTSIQTNSSVGIDADGNFVVAWNSLGSSGTDTSLYSAQAQRYAPEPSEILMLAAGTIFIAIIGRRRFRP